MLLQDVGSPQKIKIQELKKIQTGKKVDTHRAHLSTLAHKLWKCASRHVNNGWRSGFVFKRRNNICEIWRLRKAHTQSIHVSGELSCNQDVATSKILLNLPKSEISAGRSYSCMQSPLLGWSCTSARTTFWPRFQPDFRPKLRLQSGAYAAHKVCHLLLQFLPLNLPQSRFGFCFFVLPFYTFGYFFLLNHAFSFAFHSLSCFIISHPPTDHHTSNSSDIAQNSSTGPSYKI